MNNIMCIECGVMPCKRGAKKYCSYKCSLKNTSVQKMYGNYWKGKKMPESVRNKISLSAMGRPSNSGTFKKGNLINLGRKRKDVGDKNACWKPKTSINCKQCGKERLLAPNEVKDGRKFCSSICYSNWHKGINSPVYKGNKAVSRLRNRIAQLPEYKKWHAEIMKRDNYRCTICNCVHGKERPLEVDHIKRFLTIANEYEIITPEDARNCKELWDTKNGRTVCRICHRTLDTYGTKGLTKLSTY